MGIGGLRMEDRFIFNAIVTGYYDIDTPDEYKEVEPQIYLENVDLFSDEIGIDYDRLLDAVQKQLKLEKPETSQVMQFFQDNSNAISEEYVTIKPDKILQCTGLKDKNGKLIYEGNIITDGIDKYVVEWDMDEAYLRFWVREIGTIVYYTFEQLLSYEVIGNIYENPELLEEQ